MADEKADDKTHEPAPGAGDGNSGGGAGSGATDAETAMRTGDPAHNAHTRKDRDKLFPEAKSHRPPGNTVQQHRFEDDPPK